MNMNFYLLKIQDPEITILEYILKNSFKTKTKQEILPKLKINNKKPDDYIKIHKE